MLSSPILRQFGFALGEGEVFRLCQYGPRSGLEAASAVALDCAVLGEVERGGEFDGAAVAASLVGFWGHGGGLVICRKKAGEWLLSVGLDEMLLVDRLESLRCILLHALYNDGMVKGQLASSVAMLQIVANMSFLRRPGDILLT